MGAFGFGAARFAYGSNKGLAATWQTMKSDTDFEICQFAAGRCLLLQQTSRSPRRSMATPQSLLLECLDATERLAGGDERWVSARAVARRLSPTADAEEIGRGFGRLHRLGLVDLWFEGGTSYYRCAR